MKKSRLELLQEYKNQKILKQKNLNTISSSSSLNVAKKKMNLSVRSATGKQNDNKTTLDLNIPSVKNLTTTTSSHSTSNDITSSHSTSNNGHLVNNDGQSNTTSDAAKSHSSTTLHLDTSRDAPEIENFDGQGIEDTENENRVSSSNDFVLLQVELNNQKQQLKQIIDENNSLKQELLQNNDYSSDKVALVRELIDFVKDIARQGRNWDDLLQMLDNIKDDGDLKQLRMLQSDTENQKEIVQEGTENQEEILQNDTKEMVQSDTENPFLSETKSAITNKDKDIRNEIMELQNELSDAYKVIDHFESVNAAELKQETTKNEIMELQKELSDAYKVIDHFELDIKELEIMHTVKESEVEELQQKLVDSLVENKKLQDKCGQMEQEIESLNKELNKREDDEFVQSLKQQDSVFDLPKENEEQKKQQVDI